jgi:amidase
MTAELHRLPARKAVRKLRAGRLDPVELTEAALARIAELDPVLNAVPTLAAERARAAATRAGVERAERSADPRWLGGLPIVIKDTHAVAGVRTTFGSQAFADYVPMKSAPHVERLEQRGAIVIGKANTPEFAAGGQTFNDVFGATRNPWDLSRTCGGSSGGSAVAVATGMAWLADGTDFGGSLRIPAAFCGVVGLRPSPGRVPQAGRAMPFQSLDVIGPIARDTRDLALMLDALAGECASDPLSLPGLPEPFAAAVERPSGLRRVAIGFELGPAVPIEPDIARGLEAAAGRMEEAGLALERVRLEIEPAIEAFATLRAVQFAAELGPFLEENRNRFKPELVGNIEAGFGLDGRTIVAAEQARGRFVAQLTALFETADILALPTTILPPFDISQRFPEEVGGVRFPTYFHWAAPTLVISLSGCPALSLPCGFTPGGLPIGLQLVAPPRQEARLLAFARELEDRFGMAGMVPGFPAPKES